MVMSAQSVDVMTVRTYDGVSNNLDHPDWGAAGTWLRTVTPLTYADSISAPTGTDRPNPREVSNALFSQNGLINDPLGLSDFCWVWGQFIDHDIGLTPDGNEPMMIPVPAGDPWFDPMGMGQAIIPMMRNLFDPNTGLSPDNPRRHPNVITAFIDGSAVYGSDEEAANWLRTFEGGKLKVSQGNMPPFNTDTGEFDGAVDPDAPHMENPVGLSDKLYVCGDPRANENPLLLAFHTIFVREHNRLCDKLAARHPDWDDEQLFQYARKMVGGLIQSIVYEEWLPAMGVVLPPYTGYQSDINPQLFNVLTAAAFRLGHTLLNGNLQRLDNSGEVIPQGNLALRDAFFNPMVVVESGGLDPFLKGMGAQTQQEFDAKIIDDVRNFLFGQPGAGGLDLASININRGRERGLADFNSVRAAFGLQPYLYMQQINPDATVFSILISQYVDIDNIDPWVGMLSEKRMPGALFGETVMKVMEVQFTNLRDGDRFYYENDPLLTQEDIDWIRETTLHDVIMKNTGIELMQNEVFKAMPHEEICDNLTVDVSGQVHTESGAPVVDVYAALQIGSAYEEAFSGSDGAFAFPPSPGCEVNGLSLFRDGDVANGVTTLDLIKVQKHILGIQLLDSPYRMIAADVDKSEHISTFDLIRMRRVILGMDEAFEGNTSWRFVAADYEFPNPSDPWAEPFPEAMGFELLGADLEVEFIALKVGDVNESANPAGAIADPEVTERGNGDRLSVSITDQLLSTDGVYPVEVTVADLSETAGFQFGLSVDSRMAAIVDVQPGDLPGFSAANLGVFRDEGMITVSWHRTERAGDRQVLFTVYLEARGEGRLSQTLALDERKTPAAAYTQNETPQPVELNWQAGSGEAAAFRLLQNQPNPFGKATVIPFVVPEAGVVRLSVYSATGELVLTREGEFSAGRHEWQVDGAQLAGPGVYFYEVATDRGSATRRMLFRN